MRTHAIHKYKPTYVIHRGFDVERWTGKAWTPSLESPFKTMAAVRKHLKDYSWHYTQENPYRIKDFVPKKVQKYTPNIKSKNWNNIDNEMVVAI